MWRHSSNLISHYLSPINIIRFTTKFIFSIFSINNSIYLHFKKKQGIIKFVRFSKMYELFKSTWKLWNATWKIPRLRNTEVSWKCRTLLVATSMPRFGESQNSRSLYLIRSSKADEFQTDHSRNMEVQLDDPRGKPCHHKTEALVLTYSTSDSPRLWM